MYEAGTFHRGITLLYVINLKLENSMTLHEIKHMQASRREASKLREQLRKQLKVDDPYDIDAWQGKKPRWLLPLQVLGAIAMGTGLLVCIYYATLILFLL